MTKRHLAHIVLIVFTSMVVVPTLPAATEHLNRSQSAVHHEDGVPCPDCDGQDPPDGNCSCLCCPCHATVGMLSMGTNLTSPDLSAPRFGPPDTVHPRGNHDRIFRPPRV